MALLKLLELQEHSRGVQEDSRGSWTDRGQEAADIRVGGICLVLAQTRFRLSMESLGDLCWG